MNVAATGRRSHSSERGISLGSRLCYGVSLLQQHAADARVDHAERALADCRDVINLYRSQHPRGSPPRSVLEIGFGARPFRAFAFGSLVERAVAVDLDCPVLHPSDATRAYRHNGLHRTLKSVVRHVLFDRRTWRRFHRRIASAAPGYRPSAAKLVVADASRPEFWVQHPGPYDLIYSEDVFEHIPEPDLGGLTRHISRNLARDGICVTRPMVFTGISGGHDPRWYPDRVATADPEQAWRHLWDPDFTIDTYLNRLPRSRYRDIFRQYLDVVVDRSIDGHLGRPHLTGPVAARISDHSEYELLSNKVEFVLRRRDHPSSNEELADSPAG